jgi:hypothetical protein
MPFLFLNAGIIYVCLLLSRCDEPDKKQKALEISVISIIGMFVLTFGLSAYIGKYLVLACIAIWLFVVLHVFGKMPKHAATLSSAAILIVNLLATLIAR